MGRGAIQADCQGLFARVSEWAATLPEPQNRAEAGVETRDGLLQPIEGLRVGRLRGGEAPMPPRLITAGANLPAFRQASSTQIPCFFLKGIEPFLKLNTYSPCGRSGGAFWMLALESHGELSTNIPTIHVASRPMPLSVPACISYLGPILASCWPNPASANSRQSSTPLRRSQRVSDSGPDIEIPQFPGVLSLFAGLGWRVILLESVKDKISSLGLVGPVTLFAHLLRGQMCLAILAVGYSRSRAPFKRSPIAVAGIK